MSWIIELTQPIHDTNDYNDDGSTHIEQFYGLTFAGPFDALDFLILKEDELEYYLLTKPPLIKEIDNA